MARPTLYNEEIITKTKEYLESCGNHTVIVEVPSVVTLKNDLGHVYQDIVQTKEVKKIVKLPSIEGLAVHLHISRETIRVWADEIDPLTKELSKPEFSGIIEELKAKQAEMLMSSGLSGEYNSTISKVILTKHGYTDKVDMTSKDEKLPTPIFANIPHTDAISLHNSNQEDTESE